jgi:cytoskeletal protein CcmA (bactofilin family)
MSNDSGPKQTVIEAGTGFKGDFDSACPIVVKGRIEGRMTAPSLTVESTGSVSGVVKVKELRSEGMIAGEYEADYVKLSGSVSDNTVIRARALEVNLSPQRGKMQITFGQCELEVGDIPDKTEAIAAAEKAPEEARPVAPAMSAPSTTPEPPPSAIGEPPHSTSSFGAMADDGNRGDLASAFATASAEPASSSEATSSDAGASSEAQQNAPENGAPKRGRRERHSTSPPPAR